MRCVSWGNAPQRIGKELGIQPGTAREMLVVFSSRSCPRAILTAGTQSVLYGTETVGSTLGRFWLWWKCRVQSKSLKPQMGRECLPPLKHCKWCGEMCVRMHSVRVSESALLLRFKVHIIYFLLDLTRHTRPPTENHWNLQLIAVHFNCQGR